MRRVIVSILVAGGCVIAAAAANGTAAAPEGSRAVFERRILPIMRSS
jgi:hypothetical protein